MSPLREYRSIKKRYSDPILIEPYKKFFLVFEGQVTELEYFEALKRKRKEVGIHNLVEIINLERDEGDKGSSNPKKILELLRNLKKKTTDNENESSNSEDSIDEFVMIFDIDDFRDNHAGFLDFVEEAENECSLFVTSPCFELWLLLHKEKSIEEKINPNKATIFENKRVSASHRYVGKILSDSFLGFNSKTRGGFDRLLGSIDIAVTQEKLLQQDIRKMPTEIGSNIGVLVEKLKNDPRCS